MSDPAAIPLEIDVKSVKAMLDRKEDFLLLDVRTPMESTLVCISEATLIPMQEIEQRVGELEPYRNKPIVVHCHHGGRSLRMTHWLRSQGFANVRNMTGGIDRWADQVQPNMQRY